MTINRCEEVYKNNLLALKNFKKIILQFMRNSNLEDKVLFKASSIFINADDARTAGPGANLCRGPRLRHPNTRFDLDPS